MRNKYMHIIIMVFLIGTFGGFTGVYAQDYLISFEATGDTGIIASIKVYDLTSGDSVTLSGGDILNLKHALGIQGHTKGGEILRILPDPVKEKATISLRVPSGGITEISITEPSGKNLFRESFALNEGSTRFILTGLRQGTYLVTARGDDFTFSAKLVSVNPEGGTIKLTPAGEPGTGAKSLKETGDALSTDTLKYTTGDVLLYKCYSGPYTTFQTDVPTSGKTVSIPFRACADVEGHKYATVVIGTQTWMAENLNVGSMLTDTINMHNDGLIEKYCYENNEARCDIYGALYQWDEMMKYDTVPGSQGICPQNWHIPTDAEWTTLIAYLGGDSLAGGSMKETGLTHWASPNDGADNSSGFTALPGGYRYYSGTLFVTDYAVFWSSNESLSAGAWYRNLHFDSTIVTRRAYTKQNGYSVRCLKD